MANVPEYFIREYTWLLVVGALSSFAYGWGTGSNDVANAFATSVGSKTLKLWHAVVIAAIFEFVGAMVLGQVSVSTISGGIADVATFMREPEVFAYGMVVATAVSGIWNGVASYFGFNVSATHSIIGGIIGFALTYGGGDAVMWSTPKPGSIPPYGGVVPIVCAWFFAPLITGAAAAIIFLLCRTLVLRRQAAYMLAFFTLPPFVAVTTFINIYFVFVRGAAKTLQGEDGWSEDKSLWVAAAVAAGTAFLSLVIVVPLLMMQSKKHWEDKEREAAAEVAGNKESVDVKAGYGTKEEYDQYLASNPYNPEAAMGEKLRWLSGRAYAMTKYGTLRGMTVDIHDVVEDDPIVAKIHQHAEVFDPKVEHVFSYLQVFSAICVIFSHGAGEVGYMAGPLATVWFFYRYGMVFKKMVAPYWITGIGAAGLVVGLATYGYNVTRSMGTKMAKLSPSRGFAAELATGLTLMVCSQNGLPVSSSQCITGGIIGVGFCEGIAGVNWMFFVKQFWSWIATLFVVGGGTAMVFAQGLFAPNAFSSRQLTQYEDGIGNLTSQMYRNFNSTMFSYRDASYRGLLPSLNASQFNATDRRIRFLKGSVDRLFDVKKVQTVYPKQMLVSLYQALAYYQANSILTLGQVNVTPDARLCNNNIAANITNGVRVACPRPRLTHSAYRYP